MSDEQLGTTRGDQPVESGPDPQEQVEADREHEAGVGAGRTQIGTTRGGQPIESVDGPPAGEEHELRGGERGTTRGGQPVE
jgi:hypothetical protein